MAGTCPHCGIKISGQLRICPKCGNYCLKSQEVCPECKNPIEPANTTRPEELPSETATPAPRKKRKKGNTIWGCLGKIILLLVTVALCGTGYYYYHQQRMQQKEQADYERLADVTNPQFHEQFLADYPNSPHCDEIRERMLVLQQEHEEWEQVQKIISRKSILRFMKNHPDSPRQRICEDILDSIDWHEAQANGGEEAIAKYLKNHPSGRHVTEASERRNALLIAKVTPSERATIRGTLETFFSKAIAHQNVEAAREAIPVDSMVEFCGKRQADAEVIVQYARDKMEKDVIGLHYAIGQQMEVRKESLPNGSVGFAIAVNVQETISRSDTSKPTSRLYRVTALINLEQKIVSMSIKN